MAKSKILTGRPNFKKSTESLQPQTTQEVPMTPDAPIVVETQETAKAATETVTVTETVVETPVEAEATPATEETQVNEAVEAPQAPATEEAPAPEVAPEAPAAAAVVPETPAPAPVAPVVQSSSNPLLAGIEAKLKKYVENMSGNVPQNAVSGAFQQRGLLTLIQTALNMESQSDAHDALRMILQSFEANRANCFNDTLSYRFLNGTSIAPEQAQALRTLVSVFLATADLSKRGSAIKQIEWRKVCKVLNNPRQELNLMSFYMPNA